MQKRTWYPLKRPVTQNPTLSSRPFFLATRLPVRPAAFGAQSSRQSKKPSFESISGAGAIFGATGGVMEAALRTAANLIDGNNEKLEFRDVRGTVGIKEATYRIGGTDVDVCVASGLGNARKVIEMIRSGEKKYLFVEVMACPGGCVNGGGQPVQSDSVRNYSELKATRAEVLYQADKNGELRLSHENPIIQMLYDEYFEAPGKAKAHRLLHTTYTPRK